MEERINEFLPSITMCLGVTVLTFLCLKLMGRWLHSEEGREKKWTMIILPLLELAFLSVAEELVFRGPIIVAFKTISSYAWVGILTSAIMSAVGENVFLFRLLHSPSSAEKGTKIFKELESLEPEGKRKACMIAGIVRISNLLILGIIAGYCGILYQSIWIAVVIRAGWKLFVESIVIPIIVVVAVYLPDFVDCVRPKFWRKYGMQKR